MNTSITSNNFLNDLLIYFQTQCLIGMKNLLPEAIFLVWVFGIILLCMRIITKGQIFGGGSWHDYIMTILKIGTFVFIVNNWEELSISIIFKSFELAGQTASGVFTVIMPADVFMNGFKLTKEVLAGVFSTSFLAGGILLSVFKLLLCLVIIMLFGYLAIMFFMFNIEFYIFTSLSIILIPFGMISYFKFIFDNVVSALFSFGVKYMVMVFVLGLGTNLFSSWNQTTLIMDTQPQDLIKATVGVAVYCIVCLKIPDLISGMIHGSPSSDSGTQMVTSGIGAAVGGVGGRISNYAGKSLQKARKMDWGGALKRDGQGGMNQAHQSSLNSLKNIGNMFKGK